MNLPFVYNLLMGYSKDFLKGFGWIGIYRILAKGIIFAKILITYRYLSPREVGLFGLAALALGLLEMITETGINIVIVRDSRPLTYFLNTAFLVSVCRGALISFTIFLLSFVLPSFFHDQGLFPLLLIVSLIPLVKGAINPAIVAFQKNLEFHKEVGFRATLLLIDVVSAIVLVRTFHTAAGLIWSMVIAALCEVVLSYLLIKTWPKLKFSRKVFLEIVNPGKWINIAGILTFAEQNFDNVVVGRMLGATQLGYYQTAFNLTRSSIAELGTAVAQVSLPIYGRIKGDPDRLSKAFLRLLIPVALLMLVPVFLINMSRIQDIIIFFLKDKWRPMLPLLFYLSLSAWITGMNNVLNPLFLIKNKIKTLAGLYAIGLITLLALIVYLTKTMGLSGAPLAVLVSRVLVQPLFTLRAISMLRSQKK